MNIIEKIKELPDGVFLFKPQMPPAVSEMVCSTDDLKRLVTEYERMREALEQMPKEVPTNWLDPLLTGPDSVLRSREFNCRQIEALLRGVQDRLRLAATEALRTEE